MKILCAYSGLELEVSYYPGYLSGTESHHPVFDSKQKSLISAVPKVLAGDFTPIDSYLLYLALFKSTDLVEFRVPAMRTSLTASIVALNIERLAHMVGKMNVLGNEKCKEILNLPSYVISSDTRDLAPSANWITLWESNYQDYLSGYKRSNAAEKLTRRESALERLIKNPAIDISRYIGQLAEWAAIAGNFPTFLTVDQDNRPIALDEYWKYLIRKCTMRNVESINTLDLAELLDHCETAIGVEYAGIYAHTLLTVLRSAQTRQTDYMSLGSIDLTSDSYTFKILDENDSIEDANKLALIASAPLKEPVREDYNSKLGYLKAKANWELSKENEENMIEVRKNSAS